MHIKTIHQSSARSRQLSYYSSLAPVFQYTRNNIPRGTIPLSASNRRPKVRRKLCVYRLHGFYVPVEVRDESKFATAGREYVRWKTRE